MADRYYTHEMHEGIPEGESYPSVTTVLNLIPKPGLYKWFQSRGTDKAVLYRTAIQNKLQQIPGVSKALKEAEEELTSKYLEDNGEHFWDDATDIGNKAKDRGTAFHACIEEWAQTGVLKGPKIYEKQLSSLADWINENDVEVVASEIITYSNSVKYAGRCDLVCKVSGELCLVDFKFGKAVYDSYGFQLSAYRRALIELGGDDITKLLIVRIDPVSSKIEVTEFKDGYEIFEAALNLFNKLKIKTRVPKRKKKDAKANT